MEDFCFALPKIELHAHLNGSLDAIFFEKLNMPHLVSEYQKLPKMSEKSIRNLDECFKLFKIAQDLTSNKENVYLATQTVIEDFYKENVIYLELRTTPRASHDMTSREYIETVVDAILSSKDKDSIMVKLLLSIDRRHDLKQSKDSLDLIIEMKAKYPSIIRGVDFSGDPRFGLFNVELFEKARSNGLYVTLHCAEITNNKEVMEILKFRPDRLGHGTCLHPNYGGSDAIWELYLSSNIPTEICMSSNITCGTSTSYETHHLK